MHNAIAVDADSYKGSVVPDALLMSFRIMLKYLLPEICTPIQ